MSQEESNRYDVCIIGGGAAGLTAALFASRRGLKTIILTKDLGGQTASTAEIENYPGKGRIEGPELINEFLSDAMQFGCELSYEEVVGIQAVEDYYQCKTLSRTIDAHAIILAFGKTPKSLGLDREKDFAGHGIYYSAHEEELFRDKTVAIIGGGNSAIQAVVRLDSVAKKTYLVHRRDEFRAEQVLLGRLKEAKVCELLTKAVITRLNGEQQLQSIHIEQEGMGEKEYAVDAVIVHVGFETNTGFLGELVQCAPDKRIIITNTCATNQPGVFAAGDVTTTPYQQIIISAGEGAKAAISAYTYVQKKLGRRALMVDWGYVAGK